MSHDGKIRIIPGLQVTPHGTLILLLKGHIIELTIDGGIYIVNLKYGITLTISACGRMTALEHPIGKMFSYMSKVEVQANHVNGIRYAKLWKKGVSFTNDGDRSVIFLLDAYGSKTTVDWFLMMDDDFSSKAFYFNSHYGGAIVCDAFSLMYDSQYYFNNYGQENWKIGNIRISQSMNGNIRICDDFVKRNISLNPIRGSVSIKHPQFVCSASMMFNGRFFVRKGKQRVQYDGNLFVVRNDNKSAAINGNNIIKL